MKLIWCLLILVLLPLDLRGEQLESLGSETLLARGRRLLAQGERLDSAMMCLSVVARRYYRNPNDTALHAQAVSAMKQIADLHLTYFYNYGKAYDYLATAIAVAEEDNMRTELPRLYVSMASLWANNRMMLNKGEKQVAECLKRAWEVAQQDDNAYALLGIGLNMAIMSHGMSSQPFESELRWLAQQPPARKGAKDYPYARNFVKGTLELGAGRYQEAERLFRDALTLADNEGEYRDRYRLYAIIGIADAMEGRHDHRQAINEHVQGGFRQLLLDYRIREACRRLGDNDTFGNLTVEGIANSVGIASRSTFSLSFKRLTGLTPAEYRRAALR